MEVADIYVFEVPGAPVGKGRPRFTRSGRVYTDEKTRTYERLIQWALVCNSKVDKVDLSDKGGYWTLRIEAYYPIPKRTSKKKRAAMLAGEVKPKVKPDIDNVVKVVLDALNGYLYADDAQVISVAAEKAYSEKPHVTITATRWKGEDNG